MNPGRLATALVLVLALVDVAVVALVVIADGYFSRGTTRRPPFSRQRLASLPRERPPALSVVAPGGAGGHPFSLAPHLDSVSHGEAIACTHIGTRDGRASHE